MATKYWALPNNKSYVRIERNGLNTAIGTAILKSFYKTKYDETHKPIEERDSFKIWSKGIKGTIERGNPTGIGVLNPDLEYFIVKETGEWHCFTKDLPPHQFVPEATEQTKGAPHALIRHPIERFLSFINKYTLELHTYVEGFNITQRLDEIINAAIQTSDNEPLIYNNKEFFKQTTLLSNNFVGIKFYKYSEHVDNLITDLNLIERPIKPAVKRLQSFVLEQAHEEILLSKYQADLDLYNSIRYPGIILQA